MIERRTLLVRLLQVTGLIGPLLAVITPLAMAPLGIIFNVGIIALCWQRRRYWRWPKTLLILVALLAGWAFVGALWALDPGQTIKTTFRLLAMTLIGSVAVAALRQMDEADTKRLTVPLLVGVLLAVAVVLGDALSGHTLSYLKDLLTTPDAYRPFKSRFTRGATVVGLLAWPLALLLWRQYGRWPALALVAAVAACLMISDSGSARMAYLSGCAAAVLVFILPRTAFAAARVAVVAIVVALPVAVVQFPDPHRSFQEWEWLPNSWHHRITIWTFTARHIAEKPVLGWGVDGSRSIPGADDEIDVRRYDAQGNQVGRLIEAQLPLHPHNAVLQWWLELGGIGTAMITALLLWIIGRIEAVSVDRATRAALMAMFTSAFVISLVSYGFWQSWWQASMWLAAAYAVVLVGSARQRA